MAGLCFFSATDVAAQAVWSRQRLDSIKTRLDRQPYAGAYQRLIAEADSIVALEPLSVMLKPKTAASGDKHDYLSQARYFWPNPDTPDGLPYVNRDGLSNPEIELLDRYRLGDMASRVATLALANHFSEDSRYAGKAGELLRVWFLDPSTKMNPNLNYAQIVPGSNGDLGRCYGVLDGFSFVEMLDGVRLLEANDALSPDVAGGLRAWFDEFKTWLTTSPQALEESRQANNHSTAYDELLGAVALYSADRELAEKVIGGVGPRRVSNQIMPDGTQPHELWRTLAFGYSQYNLTHLIDILMMAHNARVNLLAAPVAGDSDEAYARAVKSDGGQTDVEADGIGDERSPEAAVASALDYLAQYLGDNAENWPYQQIHSMDEKQDELRLDLYRFYLLDSSRTDYLAHFSERYADTSALPARFILLYLAE